MHAILLACLALGVSGNRDADDALVLLQSTMSATPARTSTDKPWWCPSNADYVPPGTNFTYDVPLEEHYGSNYTGWWNTLPGPDNSNTLAKLRAKLTDWEPNYDGVLLTDFPGGFPEGKKYSMGNASEIAYAMYEGSKVSGLFENAPDKLKGVFWMKGNGVPEELVTLHFGEWFEEQQVWITPTPPFSWSWPWTNPPAPPSPGLYEPAWARERLIDFEAWAFSSGPMFTQALELGTCPDDDPNCWPGQTYAKQQFFVMGRTDDKGIRDAGILIPLFAEIFINNRWVSLPKNVFSGIFDLKETSTDGSKWRRDIKWGVFGCNFLDVGSYDLVKIMDKDGQPLEPYWSQWIEYAADSKHVVWSGWEDDAAMQADKKFHETEQDRLWEHAESSGLI